MQNKYYNLSKFIEIYVSSIIVTVFILADKLKFFKFNN